MVMGDDRVHIWFIVVHVTVLKTMFRLSIFLVGIDGFASLNSLTVLYKRSMVQNIKGKERHIVGATAIVEGQEEGATKLPNFILA